MGPVPPDADSFLQLRPAARAFVHHLSAADNFSYHTGIISSSDNIPVSIRL